MRVSEKGVDVLTEPLVNHCKLHENIYGVDKIDVDAVRKSVEMKISDFGFCCRNRAFDSEPIVAYGASEMMRVWLEKGLIDCAVIVCEGAGTVISASGKLVQGVGARLNGIIATSPIKEVIKHVESCGCFVLDRNSARIDQVEGVKAAFNLGFKRVAVSVAGFQAKAISEIKRLEAEAKADVLVFSVCNTCTGKADVEHLARADIACASASKIVRTEIGGKALLQLGVAIPVYALTDKGKRLILAYLAEFKDKLVVFRTSKLPYETENNSSKLGQTA